MRGSESPCKARILFQLSGSIAAYKACSAISRLAQSGYAVQTVASANALRFVGAATLEGLTGRPVLSDVFEAGGSMQHIDAARWADALVLCPASANAINKLASGAGDDLISTLFLAHDFAKPYLVVPAMNARMHAHPATQASIDRLRRWGVQVLETAFGPLACGEVGAGRLPEPDSIVSAIERALATATARPARPLRVLVTAGGTREPIDSVRALANFSTGRTGAAIASWLAERGHQVTLLRARDGSSFASSLGRAAFESAVLTKASGPRVREFSSFDDLARELQSELGGLDAYDAVVHAAAVGDYSIASIEDDSGARLQAGIGKIDSGGGLTVKLRRNPKLVSQLRAFAGERPLTVVAFKLTSGASPKARQDAIEKLLRDSRADFVVHNDLSEIGAGDAHRTSIFDSSGAPAAACSTKQELAQAIELMISRYQAADAAVRPRKEATP